MKNKDSEKKKRKGPKRKHNSGTIEKIGEVYYVRYSEGKGNRPRVSTGLKDERKARAWMEKFMAERSLEKKVGDTKSQLFHVKARLENELEQTQNKLMDLKKIPIGELYTRLFESEEGKRFRPENVIKQTERVYERFSRKMIEWLREHYPEVTSVDLVNHEICGEFLQHILETKSPDLHRRCLTFLRFIFDRYVEMGYLFENPFKGYHNQKNIKAVKKRVMDDWEYDKLHELLKTKDVETRSVFILGEETGQRFGDICCMRYDCFKDVEVEGRKVKFLIYMPSKTKKWGTEVKIPLSQRALDIIEELRDANLDAVYLHPTWREQYIRNNSVAANKRASEIFKEAGLKTTDENGRTNLGYHSLRHGMVSKLALSSKNVPMTTIMSFVGHTRERMSEYYSHANMKSRISAIEALGEECGSRSVSLSKELYGRYDELKGEKSDEDFMTLLLEVYAEKKAEDDEENARAMKGIEDIVDRGPVKSVPNECMVKRVA